MKVLQVLYSGLGGHGSVFKSMIDADEKGEWDHQLLFYGIEDLLPAYSEYCTQKKIPYTYIRKKKGGLKLAARSVRAVLNKYEPDVIILHSPNLIFFTIWWFCFLRKKKVFVVEHTSNDVKGFVELFAGLFSLLLARKVIYLSLFYQQQMKKKFWFLPVHKKSIIIQNGIDLEKFKPSRKPENTNELHAGMIGRFILPKNQALIVEALEKGIHSGLFHRKTVIHFAGNGGSLSNLQEAVQKKGLQDVVQFHGLLNENEIVVFLNTLDFYVHVSYAETMCTAVMQALACGIPVVASNIPGINDIVLENENAFLVDNSVDGLLSGIGSMQDNNLREKMSSNARKFAEKSFSSNETFILYNKMILS